MSVQTGQDIGMKFGGAIGTGLTGRQAALNSSARSVARSAVSAASGVMSSSAGYSIGKQIVQGVINGVGAMGSALNSKMRSLANSAVAAFRSALDMHSPPRVFEDIGKMIPLAVGIGTEANEKAALNPIVQLAKDMIAAWPDVELPVPVTNNPHKTAVLSGADGGMHFHFYGDLTVREEADIERIGAQFRAEVIEIMRGGGV